MKTHEARIITQTIAAPFDAAYELAHQPETFKKWAAGLSSSLHRDGDDWVADTPQGEARVEFSPRNDYGVLDHHVRWPDGREVYIPLRLLKNGDGTEVELVVYREDGMSDAEFERDTGNVKKDLATLKALLEKTASVAAR